MGEFNSSESLAEYRRLIAELAANPSGVGCLARERHELSVNELILTFWKHAEKHYRHPDGTPTSELAEFKISLTELKTTYGHTPAREFGPLALKAVREAMIRNPRTRTERSKRGRTLSRETGVIGLSRNVTNQRISRIKRMFAWGVENELVPPAVLYGLKAVAGLRLGRTDARETSPVQAVDPAHVAATVAVLPPTMAGMVEFQRLTRCRPGEVCQMRAGDID